MSSEKKPIGGSSFPFTSQLFGTNENQDSSSNDIFASMFSSNSNFQGTHQSKVSGKSQAFSSYSKSEGNSKHKEEKNDMRRRNYEEDERNRHPCHFSSSIYYGGQDVYNTPQTQFNSSLNKDDGEDDSAAVASRGNWWQGSLYY